MMLTDVFILEFLTIQACTVHSHILVLSLLDFQAVSHLICALQKLP